MPNPAIDFPWRKVCVSGDTIVNDGLCVLHNLVFNGITTVGVADVYDGIDNGGTRIARLVLDTAASVSIQPITLSFDCEMLIGIFIEFTDGLVGNFTCMWR